MKTENYLNYLAHAKHPVEHNGRQMMKVPDIKQIEEMVDKIKNLDFFALEDKEKVTKAPHELVDSNLDEFKRKRHAFYGYSKNSGRLERARKKKKTKRKSTGLFDDVSMFHADTLNYEEQETEKNTVMPEVARALEDRKLKTDLEDFKSRLNGEQRMDITEFLDHVNDEPKPFKFDTTPFLLTQLQKLKHSQNEKQDEQPEEQMFGARKFFDFKTPPAKRNIDEIEDLQMVAKLKSKLIAEYRQHHPIVDFSEIHRKIESDKEMKADKSSDDFLNHYYLLNDGSTELKDVIKPYKKNADVLSPFELNLNLKLDNEYKELDPYELKDHADDIPLFKPEIHDNKEDDEFSP